MSSPTDKEVYDYIVNGILKGVKEIEKKLENDVKDMCERVLLPLVEECKIRTPNRDVPQSLKQSFKDIYGSLKLHLIFHRRADSKELNKLGQEIGLTGKELNETCAIDPGSKLLEIFSDIVEISDGPKGSEGHANAVMAQAKYWFGKLTNEEEEVKKEIEDEKKKKKKEKKKQKKNLFKPKVLARVSHNGQCFVGSSVAVSHFLRPLYLCERICDFKQSLKKAVVDFQPLELTDDKVHWNSSAFWFKGEEKPEYESVKLPCENCKFMFKKLPGFLGEKDNLGQEGASAKPVRRTFLAACGEYPPINQCLHDAESDNEAVNGALNSFYDKCVSYYQTFRYNVQNCILAYESYKSEKDESKKLKILRDAYDEFVKDKIHIFGIKPECNDTLKP